MKSCITTYSKIEFDPLNPVREDIVIEDIAHSLSLLARANGHFPDFYSVAQHCIACCEEAIARGYSVKVALACLLHDASEAYMSDVTRPVKQHLHKYLEIEKELQDFIYCTYLGETLTEEEQELVKVVDDSLLFHEFKHYTTIELDVEKSELISSPAFRFVPFKEVEEAYKELFHNLMKL